MAAERRLTDEDVADIRRRVQAGERRAVVARAHGVTVQHVGRIVRGEQRAALGPPHPVAPVEGGPVRAVAEYLDGVELDREGRVLAATARTLAGKLEQAAASETAGAAQAAPRLAAELVAVVERLEGRVPGEPDALDRILAQRAERVAAADGDG